MILRYLANTLEKTFEFSQQEIRGTPIGEELLITRTHTNQNIKRNKQNKDSESHTRHFCASVKQGYVVV